MLTYEAAKGRDYHTSGMRGRSEADRKHVLDAASSPDVLGVSTATLL